MPTGDTDPRIMIEREPTNPRITLEDVPVSESACRKRTGEIMAVQQQTLAEVLGIGRSIEKHRAWHDGIEQARRGAQNTGQFWIRLVGLVLAVTSTLAIALWTIAELVSE
jgi:hypothetical protein